MNETVMKNSIHPESTLKKKHNSIAYHRTREAVAAGTIRATKEDGGKTNLADVLTKPLPQATSDFLCDRFIYCRERIAEQPRFINWRVASVTSWTRAHTIAISPS